MPTKPIIVVLDDMKPRVQWLRRHFDSRAHVIWKTTTSDFLATMDNLVPDQVAMIIFDHDLDLQDGGDFPNGPDGLCGFDAAASLGDSWRNTEVLVWSRNPWGADRITDKLHRRNFYKLRQIMFGFDSWVFKVIKEALDDF